MRRVLPTTAAALLLVALLGSTAIARPIAPPRDPGPPIPKPAIAGGGQQVQDLTGGLAPGDLAQALAGEGIEVSNVEFTGDERAAGTYAGFADVFGIGDGIALSSGSVAGDEDAFMVSNLIGPNVDDGVSASFQTAGDPDLDELVDFPTLDAAVLEFDFVPDGSDISFDYVFGSDEYNEFVDSQFNDVFAFFVNGENCALVPDPAGGPDPVPVTINTINNNANADLYNDNDVGDLPTPPFNTELDGFTTVLTCAASVQAGEQNHLKLAIADVSDTVLDSTVLLSAGSLEINDPPVADDQAVTTLVDTPVDITLTGSDPDGDTVTFEIAEQPENGTLSGPPPNVTYTPDEGFLGTDTFTFQTNDGALVSEPATVTVEVVEQIDYEFTVAADEDQLSCDDGSVEATATYVSGAGEVEVSLSRVGSADFSDSETLLPGESTALADPVEVNRGETVDYVVSAFPLPDGPTEVIGEFTVTRPDDCETPTPTIPVPTPTLPPTGGEASSLGGVALALIAAGVGLVAVARHRLQS